MNRSSTASYDLFKLIVALVLAVILILMLLRGCATNPEAPSAAATTAAPLAAEATVRPTDTVAEPTVAASPTPSPTSAAPEPTSTPTPVAATLTPTPEPESVDLTPTPTLPAADAPTPAEGSAACNTSVESRLSVGDTARVLQRLNVRNAPAIDAPILLTNPTQTQVEVIGGPVCTPRGESAYLWWQIRLADGTEGWSAESPLQERTYFLEPIP